jgi:hypothetical protein
MNRCPHCNQETLLERIDNLSGFKYRVCISCAYYESDSEAYRSAPYLFKDLGYRILAEMNKKVKKYGFSDAEVQGWIENSSDINRIVENVPTVTQYPKLADEKKQPQRTDVKVTVP